MVPPCSDRISRVPPYSRIVCALRIRGYHPLWPDFPDRSTYLQTTTGLFRVRSPLLAESLLMSFPPGTEMFQFPGFASLHYVFMQRYPCGWVAPFGYPRINACSRLPVAFRSVPRPSSPPGAKASTECPSYTRYFDAAPKSRVHHAQKPSSGAVVRVQPAIARSNRDGNDRLFEDSPGNIYSAHNRILSNRSAAGRLRGHREKFDKIVYNASEPSPPTVGALSSQTAIPGQTIRPNDAPVLRGQLSGIRTGSTG